MDDSVAHVRVDGCGTRAVDIESVFDECVQSGWSDGCGMFSEEIDDATKRDVWCEVKPRGKGYVMQEFGVEYGANGEHVVYAENRASREVSECPPDHSAVFSSDEEVECGLNIFLVGVETFASDECVAHQLCFG